MYISRNDRFVITPKNQLMPRNLHRGDRGSQLIGTSRASLYVPHIIAKNMPRQQHRRGLPLRPQACRRAGADKSLSNCSLKNPAARLRRESRWRPTKASSAKTRLSTVLYIFRSTARPAGSRFVYWYLQPALTGHRRQGMREEDNVGVVCSFFELLAASLSFSLSRSLRQVSAQSFNYVISFFQVSSKYVRSLVFVVLSLSSFLSPLTVTLLEEKDHNGCTLCTT